MWGRGLELSFLFLPSRQTRRWGAGGDLLQRIFSAAACCACNQISEYFRSIGTRNRTSHVPPSLFIRKTTHTCLLLRFLIFLPFIATLSPRSFRTTPPSPSSVWRRPATGYAGPLGGDFPLVTREGHHVLDVIFTSPINDLVQVAKDLDQIDGVVDHGVVYGVPFHYMAMADNRQRIMPLPNDRLPPRGQPLAYKEAVWLIDPINPDLKGEVDDKYQYSCENKDSKVHGWICFEPPIGFWLITPSNEFRTGGPVKQDLTSHVGPTTLSVFVSTHYAGTDLELKFRNGEYWKKVLGPVFLYLNSTSGQADPVHLWKDAKLQMQIETETWPYNFPVSEDFPAAEQRGSINGRLLVRDWYIDDVDIPADSAYVGLASPGEAESWQIECKGYQFWTKAEPDGSFMISNVRPGVYNLHAWVPGFIGDYKYYENIIITPGCDMDLNDLLYEPPRDGPTLWEIGIPDRSAAEFYVPDPNDLYINKLYVNHPDRFRQYGLWERYAELYPTDDLVYTVDISDYEKDWFYAQVTRKVACDPDTYQATTWQIKFDLDNVAQNGSYKLRIALAAAKNSDLQVRINDPDVTPAHFSTGVIGEDNSIARHGIHGLYWLFNIDVQGSWLIQGDNTIFLTQARSTSPFQGIMYDYIRLEGPPESDPKKKESKELVF